MGCDAGSMPPLEPITCKPAKPGGPKTRQIEKGIHGNRKHSTVLIEYKRTSENNPSLIQIYLKVF